MSGTFRCGFAHDSCQRVFSSEGSLASAKVGRKRPPPPPPPRVYIRGSHRTVLTFKSGLRLLGKGGVQAVGFGRTRCMEIAHSARRERSKRACDLLRKPNIPPPLPPGSYIIKTKPSALSLGAAEGLAAWDYVTPSLGCKKRAGAIYAHTYRKELAPTVTLKKKKQEFQYVRATVEVSSVRSCCCWPISLAHAAPSNDPTNRNKRHL